jgi:hypothetical protein
MHMLQTTAFYMCIDLGRRDIRVTEHNLNRAKIRTAFKQMGGKRMPEHVGRNDLCNPRTLSTASQQLPKGLPCQRAAPPRNKHIP